MPRRVAPLLLLLAACSEPSSSLTAPKDRFAFPAALGLVTRQNPGPGESATALLVASGNYDLSWDGPDGGTVISVDPSAAVPPPNPSQVPAPEPEWTGGSLGRPGGVLKPYGAGANVGSYAGELVVVNDQTCPGATGQVAYLATRFADQLWRLPVGANGEVEPCTTPGCAISVSNELKDPFSLALACRKAGSDPEKDPARRSLFMGYLRVAQVNAASVAGWIAELDLDKPEVPARTIPLGGAPVAGMAYDALNDQLYVLTQPVLSAQVFVLNLTSCKDGLPSCARPSASSVDLFNAVPGVEPQAIALSNPQAGLGRRAYVSARVYDAGVAALLQARPSADVTGLLLVLDVEPGLDGKPALRLLRTVTTGLGTSQVRVLPQRPAVAGQPVRDLVVVSSVSDGLVTVYDDEVGEVVRVIPFDPATGAAEAGRGSFGMAVEDQGDHARVYVAASRANVVGAVDIPFATPGLAHAVRDGDVLQRIGGAQ